MKYAEIILLLRKKLLLTQTEFAELIGASYTTICRWEKGIFEPTMKMKRKIAELCKANGIKID